MRRKEYANSDTLGLTEPPLEYDSPLLSRGGKLGTWSFAGLLTKSVILPPPHPSDYDTMGIACGGE